MNDRALICVGSAGAVLAAICCATRFLAGVLPLAASAWLAGAGLVVLPLVIACFGLRVEYPSSPCKADCGDTKIHNEGVKP